MNPYKKNILEENLHLISSPFNRYPECLRDLFEQEAKRLREKALTTIEGVVKQVFFHMLEGYGGDFQRWDESVPSIVCRLTESQLCKIAQQNEDFSDLLDKPDQIKEKLIATLNKQFEQSCCPTSEEEVSCDGVYENIQKTKAYAYVEWRTPLDPAAYSPEELERLQNTPPALFSSEAIYSFSDKDLYMSDT